MVLLPPGPTELPWIGSGSFILDTYLWRTPLTKTLLNYRRTHGPLFTFKVRSPPTPPHYPYPSPTHFLSLQSPHPYPDLYTPTPYPNLHTRTHTDTPPMHTHPQTGPIRHLWASGAVANAVLQRIEASGRPTVPVPPFGPEFLFLVQEPEQAEPIRCGKREIAPRRF